MIRSKQQKNNREQIDDDNSDDYRQVRGVRVVDTATPSVRF